jgi:DNA polymerase III gamma/tau subunit
MLTREAWNALLKILEEPPPRVIFIFATTEPQKIQQSASPILSRCQRFDFRRIGVGDITHRLEEVLAGEGTEAPEEALRTIARRAEGGMRDALSLLDQVLALTGGDVSQEAVSRVLGLVEEERYLELLDILKDRRHGSVFGFVESLLDEGYDMVEFHRGLVDILRQILRLRLDEGDPVVGFREDLRPGFQERSAAFSPGDLVRMLAQATELEATGSLRRSSHPRLLMEMLLLRLSYLDRTVGLEELLRKVGGVPPESEAGTPGEPLGAVPEAVEGQDLGTVVDSASPLPLQEAWDRTLTNPRGLPKGVLAFLKAAKTEVIGEGAIRLTVPPGPGLDRLRDPVALRALKDALASLAGSPPEIQVVSGEEGNRPAERITESTVRDGRLKELVEKEPTLGEAVKELDLELMD